MPTINLLAHYQTVGLKRRTVNYVCLAGGYLIICCINVKFSFQVSLLGSTSKVSKSKGKMMMS